MVSIKSPSDLTELPQNAENWYVSVRKLHRWIINDKGEIFRPFLLLGTNMESGMFLMSDMSENFPLAEKIRNLLFHAMQKPHKSARQKIGRPRCIFFEQSAVADTVSSFLSEISVGCEHKKLTETVDALVYEFEEHLGGGEEDALAGILSADGVTPQLVGDVFSAAAAFYRAEPWIYLADNQPLAVEFPDRRVTLFVQLMGNGGVDYGFVAYRSWEDLLYIYQVADNVKERIPAGGWLSFSFTEEHLPPFADLDAIEQYGWEIASKNAYPLPATYHAEHVERPDVELLSLYNLILRAVPVFVGKHLKSDGKGDFSPVKATVTVLTYQGQSKVNIKYPAGDLSKEFLPTRSSRDFGGVQGGNDGGTFNFDRRAMEGDLAKMIDGFAADFDDPALEKAQELMYKAWEEQNAAKSIMLAYQALSISPNCADAYVLLAEEEADTLKRAAEFYTNGVDAGERALGKKFFKENEGYFWGLLSTRPYMRARQGLANYLWSLGRLDEAKQHYKEMLRLNPGDNQGVRYSLLNLLLETNSNDELTVLLEQYDGDYSPDWLYTNALLVFREHGASPEANAALELALEQNRHVPLYLTGDKRIPVRLPDSITVGHETEAVSYASGHLNYWRRTLGAVDWLRRQTQGETAKAKKKIKPQTQPHRHKSG